MKRITKKGIKDFVHSIEPELRVKFQKQDIEIDMVKGTIYIGKEKDTTADTLYMNFIEKLNSKCKGMNIFLLSILHEIGHWETWTQEKAVAREVEYIFLQKQNLDMEEHFNKYFALPLELDATLWAIDYALSHQDIMEEYNWLNNE